MLYLGKVVNTHCIKGEVRILSNFKYKDVVFKKGSHLFILGDELVINSYRVHKGYDMVTFEGIKDINEVLKYNGKKVFIKKDDYNFPGILNEDLIGTLVVCEGRKIGIVKEIYRNVNQDLMVLDNGVMIPMVPFFIKSIGMDKIEVNMIEGLLNED